MEKERKLIRLEGGALSAEGQKLKGFLLTEVKGQERAVKDLVRAFEISKAGLRDPNRPIHVALLLGPSGVGKTHLAKMLAKHFFGDPNGLTMVACETFSQPHEIAKLIGSPPGYVRSDEEPLFSQFGIDRYHFEYRVRHEDGFFENNTQLGKLIEQRNRLQKRIAQLAKEGKLGTEVSMRLHRALESIKDQIEKLNQSVDYLREQAGAKALKDLYAELYDDRKFDLDKHGGYKSIIVFDEIERADPRLHNLLLGIMNEGRVTLANHSVTRFNGSFIFMTSNIGWSEMKATLTGEGIIGFKPKNRSNQGADQLIYEVAREAAEKFFEPAFMGRLDRIIVFRPLDTKTMAEILELQLRDLRGRIMKSDVPIDLIISPDVKNYLIDRAMKYPDQGARLLLKRIEEKLFDTDGLIGFINSGKVMRGDRLHVELEVHDDEAEIVFFNDPNSNSNPDDNPRLKRVDPKLDEADGDTDIDIDTEGEGEDDGDDGKK